MKTKKNTQIITIVVLSFAILFMSIGFAAFSDTLNIEGTTNVSAAKWSVHFDKNSYQEKTGSVPAATPTIGDTSITYEITLERNLVAIPLALDDGSRLKKLFSKICRKTLTN